MTAKGTTLGEADRALVEAASEAIRRRYRYDWQEVGAALRTRSGKIFTGVSLDAYLGRMAVCAEEGGAITVVSPCGACRELIWDYDRNARVIVPGRDSPETVGIGELIPNKYSRERGT